ncbi:MAG TPA: hypothetical protein PKA64_21340 [Myxococcota bacterium]|nr:hypothetical protein [Myxococcota bacterium]
MTRDRSVQIGLWLIAVAWMTWSASYTWESVVDDAYITARYASELAAGHGLVFNPGEPAVEGITNLAWAWWISVGLRMGFTALDWMLAWGWICAAAALALTIPLTSALSGRRDSIAALPALLLAGVPHFAIVATNGLETTQWVMMVLATVAAWLGLEGRARWLAGLVGAALVWVRPEGAAVVALLIAVDLTGRDGRALPFAAPAVASEAALLAWRWSTYGRLVPNTWDAKANFPITDTFQQNGGYFYPERWVLYGFLAMFTLAALAVVSPARRDDVRPPPPLRRAAGVLGVTLLLAFIPLTVNEWMPGLRLFEPSMALTMCVLGAAVGRFSAPSPRIWWIGARLLAFPALLTWESADRARDYDGHHTVQRHNGAARAAFHLQQNLPPGSWLATRDAGVLAYFVGPEVKVAELHQRALTQPHPDGRDALIANYTPRNPEAFISTLRTADQPNFEYPGDRKVWERLSEPYVYLGRVNQHYRRHYDVYVRADLHVPPLPEGAVVSFAGPKPGDPGAPPSGAEPAQVTPPAPIDEPAVVPPSQQRGQGGQGGQGEQGEPAGDEP